MARKWGPYVTDGTEFGTDNGQEVITLRAVTKMEIMLRFEKDLIECITGYSLMVQWLRLHASNAGDLGLSPSQRTREKAMAPRSSTLAWKIPWMEESDRLQFMGSQKVRHD